MHTDYHAHENRYRALREQAGRTGWGTASEKREQISQFERLLRGIHLPPVATILELGCGAGELGIHFAAQGHRISGIDISSTAIDWARQNAQNAGVPLDAHVGDTRALPFTNASFHLVLDACLLHCIIGEDRQTVLREAVRVLRPGGLLAGVTMCGPIHAPLREAFEVQGDCLWRQGKAIRHIGGQEAIERELQAAGLDLLQSICEQGAENDTLLYLAQTI